MLLVSLADFGRRSKGRGLLEFVPERWELPPLSEERLPAVELGPTEISGSQPRQHRGMKVANRFAMRRDSLDEIEDDPALLQGKPGSLGECDGRIMERPAHWSALWLSNTSPSNALAPSPAGLCSIFGLRGDGDPDPAVGALRTKDKNGAGYFGTCAVSALTGPVSRLPARRATLAAAEAPA